MLNIGRYGTAAIIALTMMLASSRADAKVYYSKAGAMRDALKSWATLIKAKVASFL